MFPRWLDLRFELWFTTRTCQIGTMAVFDPCKAIEQQGASAPRIQRTCKSRSDRDQATRTLFFVRPPSMPIVMVVHRTHPPNPNTKRNPKAPSVLLVFRQCGNLTGPNSLLSNDRLQCLTRDLGLSTSSDRIEDQTPAGDIHPRAPCLVDTVETFTVASSAKSQCRSLGPSSEFGGIDRLPR